MAGSVGSEDSVPAESRPDRAGGAAGVPGSAAGLAGAGPGPAGVGAGRTGAGADRSCATADRPGPAADRPVATMRAVRLGPGMDYAVAEFPVPEPAPGQVLVEMVYASVCGSDVHLVDPDFHRPEMVGSPGYPGHEGVGRVVASRADGIEPGAVVLTVPSGRFGGCFAEYQALDAGSVIPLHEGDDLPQVLMAQQLGCTIAALAKYWREGMRSAAVIGLGSAGQFFVQLLRARGVEVFASDVDAARIAFGREAGARAVHADDLAATVAQAHPEGVDLVIEAAGLDATRALAIELVRVRGVVGNFGYPEFQVGTFPTMAAFRKAATVEWFSNAQGEPGQWCFHEALDAIRTGAIEVGHMTEVRMGLEDVPRALAITAAHGEGAAKITIAIRPESAIFEGS